ncbi:MAG: alpha/beta hydrolase [Planctomycetaceae bacterium]
MLMRSPMLLLLVLTEMSVFCGCTTVEFVQLREKPPNPIMERLTQTTFGGPAPSARVQHFLTVSGYSGAPDFARMLQHGRNVLGGEHHREALHALSEISYLAAEKTKAADRPLALELYLDAAGFSWMSIATPDETSHLIDPNSSPHRETVDIYNTSLQHLLRLAKGSGEHLRQHIHLPISGRVITVETAFPTEWLSDQQLGEFAFVCDYELRNLRNRHVTHGVGVPLMVRRERPPESSELEDFYADDLSLPVTAVATFNPSSWEGNPKEPIRLQLLDPRDSDGVRVGETLLPLEADLSTPLAWYLTDPKNSLLETFAFFRSDKARDLEGLYMIQPYDPDRIPVLMVHGIWSSPITWMEMFNDLQADPAIRDRYQFWFYMYPTGEPLTFSQANLRDRLKEVRLRCDPFGQNEKLDQMVVVGHSMGGLMAYLLTVNSEDKLWKGLSHLSVDQIEADSEIRRQIQRVFFFESDSSIDRIVTIASPFNGSGYANRFTSWLGGSLVSLPSNTSRLSQLIFKQNHQSLKDRIFAPRTSLDSLKKDSAVLNLVSQTTVPPDVIHHNVVGLKKHQLFGPPTDGVVLEKSAHRKDAVSEVHVRATHSEVHRHPQTIAEVRRILLEHLQQLSHSRTATVATGPQLPTTDDSVRHHPPVPFRQASQDQPADVPVLR